ncbi:thioredoxin family protein [Limosilactobacillus sp.]|jgi:thioredoxin 1|uniref:thioredoxin family protein n=1 Tax=Limosilactobacillus sp. TaxID=2773925 RepID=UPI00345E9468
MNVNHLDTDAPGITLLAFENDWCAQCYTERPVIQKIEDEYRGQLTVQSVNVATDATLADKYRVQTAPSMVLIKDGEVVERIPHFIDHNQLESFIRYYL